MRKDRKTELGKVKSLFFFFAILLRMRLKLYLGHKRWNGAERRSLIAQFP